MKQIKGFWFPDDDNECYKAVIGQAIDIRRALPLCADRRCVVQAGGNVGVWAGALAEEFETVWTFEPVWQNYECLLKNLEGIENINSVHAALSYKGGVAGVSLEPRNAGAHWITHGADVAMVTVDSLKLPACDLMILDTEGNEADILVGARKTLDTFKPVLMIEDKGCSERFGVPQGWTDAIEGYTVADRVHRDVILIPE